MANKNFQPRRLKRSFYEFDAEFCFSLLLADFFLEASLMNP